LAISDDLLARLQMPVGPLADPWSPTCYGWDRQLLRCHRVPAVVSTVAVTRTTLADTYEHRSVVVRTG